MDSDAAPERDLFCVSCGYNLRGLAGDPVRCPECAFSNAVAIMEIPAASIQRQLRQMESSAAYSLLALGVLAVGFLISAATLRFRGGVGPHAGSIIGIVLLPVCLFYVRESCARAPGWFLALLLYWIFGLLMFAGAIGIFVASIALTVQATERYRVADGWNTIVIIVAILLTLVLPVQLWVRITYRAATSRLHALQRIVAVATAERELRRQIGMSATGQ